MTREVIIVGVVVLNLFLLVLLFGAFRLLRLNPTEFDASFDGPDVVDLDAELRALFSHDSWNGAEMPNGYEESAGA